MQRSFARFGAVAFFVGAPILLLGTFLHPMNADPNVATEAFAEYASDRIWIASHLAQFLGIAVLGAGLAALTGLLDGERVSPWARAGTVGATASIALAAALQAVDGIALKMMVDRWAAAAGPAQELAFEAAFAVRQIEIGLASLFSLLFGITVAIIGIAIIRSGRFADWLGWVAVLGGLGTSAGGIAQAHLGFSSIPMTISMAATVVLLAWTVAAGIAMWRISSRELTPGI